MELFKKDYPLDRLAVAALRSLVIDETNRANSGHPGMPLDIAPALYVLFKNHLVADPAHPEWVNRDRFVLSAGHCSALLYAMLHLSGYAITMEDLKRFRQLNSITPGHPEVTVTPGVDATAGPLGQGIAQAVGMAIAEEKIRASYPEGETILSHYTYCLCGDGCLEEGLSQEAISLAGHQKLNKLVLIYDANTSTLDGPTTNSLTEDVKLRFLASQWNVLEVKDGNDLEAMDHALYKARDSQLYPTLIIVHTKIGYGSVNEGSHKTHGAPLGLEDGKHCKEVYEYDYPEFTVPKEVYDQLAKNFGARGKKGFEDWTHAFSLYETSHPQEAKLFQDAFSRNVKGYLLPMPNFDPSTSEATRVTSGRYIVNLAKVVPFTFGGSADVASSTKTDLPNEPYFDHEHRNAKNMAFGIREFAMASIQNGILLHGGLLTYVGSFLIFSDYMKAAIRMSALEKLPSIYVLTHDSVALGEDGPTHQPIEQIMGLRAMPNVYVYRPCDARETYACWDIAVRSVNAPSCLILSRQNLPLQERSSAKLTEKGAYLISSAKQNAQIELLASGSEVATAISVQKILLSKGVDSEVISMPCLEKFDEQSQEYRDSVLTLSKDKRFSFEMGSGQGWYKYADHVFSIEDFGRSAPGEEVVKAVGFAPETLAGKVLSELGK